MDKAFIDEIVAKVVALVRAKMATAVPSQRVLMLFSGASTGYVVGMETIQLLTQAHHNLTVFMTASALHVIGEDNVRRAGAQEIITPQQWVNTPKLVREADMVLLPTLSMNTAARLALGSMDSLFSTLVLGALLADKPVIAVRDGADPYGNGGLVFSETTTGAPALRQKLAAHLQVLADYGVTLVQEEEFVTAVLRCLQPASQPEPAPVAKTIHLGAGQAAILTVADLGNYQPGSSLHLPAGTRLTPLAKETAHRRGLRLLFD
ncbi:MAG: flavoprotein [Chloroflexota bacterium]|nr:hypothetical protein [Anaerolineales bacterium]MCA9976283.1 hypothetical protein [Anaerolineales bacterium]MCB8968243.1 hypothetical protein [Ardenticatenaceae bacterium]